MAAQDNKNAATLDNPQDALPNQDAATPPGADQSYAQAIAAQDKETVAQVSAFLQTNRQWPPPDLTSPDGLALLHSFVTYLKDPAKPEKSYAAFLDEINEQFNPPITETFLANGMYDFAFTSDITDILANIEEIEQKLKGAETDIKEITPTTEFHKPISTADLEKFQKSPSYQGTVNVLDIYLDRARSRKFFNKTTPEYEAVTQESATINYQMSFKKAFAPYVAKGVVTQEEVENLSQVGMQVLEQQTILTPKQFIKTIEQSVPGGLPPQLATLLTETMQPPLFEQVRQPIFEVQYTKKVNQTLQQFKTRAEDLTKNVLTKAPEPVHPDAGLSQEISFYNEQGLTNHVRNKLEKKLNVLVDQGIVTKELKERLVAKSSYHVQRELSIYASAKRQRDLYQAVTAAFSQAVQDEAPQQVEQVLENINLHDAKDPLITQEVAHTLDANRVMSLLPYAAEGEQTEAVTAILKQLSDRELITGQAVFGQELLRDLTEMTQLKTELQPLASGESPTPPRNVLMRFVAENDYLATEELTEPVVEAILPTVVEGGEGALPVAGEPGLEPTGPTTPQIPLTQRQSTVEPPIGAISEVIEEQMQLEQSALMRLHTTIPLEEAKLRQANINNGLRLAQFIRVAEADPVLSKYVMLELFTDFDDIRDRLGTAVAHGNVAHARVYQTILTFHAEHENALVEFFRDDRRHKQVHEFLKPFNLEGWRDSSVFLPWMKKELDDKYKNNYVKWMDGQAKLMKMHNYFTDRAKYVTATNILLTNPFIKGFANGDIVGTVVRHYRNKILMASGKWIYKSSARSVVRAVKPVYRLGKAGVGAGMRAFTQARTGTATSRRFGFIFRPLRESRVARILQPITRPIGAAFRGVSGATKRTMQLLTKRLGWMGRMANLGVKGIGKVISFIGKVLNPIFKVLFLLSAMKLISKLAKRVIKVLGAYLYGLLLWLKQFMFVFYAAMVGGAIGGVVGLIGGAIVGAKLGALIGTLICGPLCGLAGGIFGTVVGGAVGFFLGSALGATIAAATVYAVQFFVLPHLAGALTVGAGALALGLIIGLGWWTLPLVAAGFFIGAGVHWLLEKFFSSSAGLNTEIAVSNITHNPPHLISTNTANSAEVTTSRITVEEGAAGTGGPGLPQWATSALYAGAGSAGFATALALLLSFVLPSITPPEVNRTHIKLIAPSTVPNATAIPYAVQATFPNCADKVTIENPLPQEADLTNITDPYIKTGGVMKIIHATASAQRIIWTIYTNCASGPQATPGQGQITTASLITTSAAPGTSYLLTSDFCQGANPQGCSLELKRTFEAAANYANIPAGVIAGIANQEWKATFKHTDEEIRQWSRPGETKEPNGPTNHPRFINGCAQSFVFAEGPMQFLTGKGGYPDVWSSYKAAALQAGIRQQGYNPEVCNVLDAIFGASKKLKTNSGITFSNKKEQWERADVDRAAKAYLGACIPNYNPKLNYCEGVWQYYRTFTPKEL